MIFCLRIYLWASGHPFSQWNSGQASSWSAVEHISLTTNHALNQSFAATCPRCNAFPVCSRRGSSSEEAWSNYDKYVVPIPKRLCGVPSEFSEESLDRTSGRRAANPVSQLTGRLPPLLSVSVYLARPSRGTSTALYYVLAVLHSDAVVLNGQAKNLTSSVFVLLPELFESLHTTESRGGAAVYEVHIKKVFHCCAEQWAPA